VHSRPTMLRAPETPPKPRAENVSFVGLSGFDFRGVRQDDNTKTQRAISYDGTRDYTVRAEVYLFSNCNYSWI
jgi:hypothetical protein